MDSGGPAPDAGPKRRRVSPAAAAAARVPETWAFCAGRADDGLSKCRGCRTRIEPGALRVGKIRRGRQQEGGKRELSWFGAACCLGHKDLKDLYSTALLFEFGALEPAEQEAMAVGLERASVTRIDEKQMLSRMLYPNPVCMLSTPAHAATGGPNVMTISWLTPLNNFGLVLLSVNAKRHTAAKLRSCPDFVLNIPAHGLEETVLAIGKHSGAQGDKFAKLSIEACSPGWQPLGDVPPEPEAAAEAPDNPFAALAADDSGSDDGSSSEDAEAAEAAEAASPAAEAASPAAGAGAGVGAADAGEGRQAAAAAAAAGSRGELVAAAAAVAHIVCTVRSMEESAGHWLVRAEMSEAYVQRRYWNGKQLCPRDATVPPFLTFLGSQRFGFVVAEPPAASSQHPPGEAA